MKYHEKCYYEYFGTYGIFIFIRDFFGLDAYPWVPWVKEYGNFSYLFHVIQTVFPE